jgi:hypothetical protein
MTDILEGLEDDIKAVRSIAGVVKRNWAQLSPAARAYLRVKLLELINESPK